MIAESLTIWSPKPGNYTVSECIKYPTKSYRLSRTACKPGDWN